MRAYLRDWHEKKWVARFNAGKKKLNDDLRKALERQSGINCPLPSQRQSTEDTKKTPAHKNRVQGCTSPCEPWEHPYWTMQTDPKLPTYLTYRLRALSLRTKLEGEAALPGPCHFDLGTSTAHFCSQPHCGRVQQQGVPVLNPTASELREGHLVRRAPPHFPSRLHCHLRWDANSTPLASDHGYLGDMPLDASPLQQGRAVYPLF